MSLFHGLKANQVLSAIASLSKQGYIIELPSGHIILKPSWFAAAASITLSPPPNKKSDGLTNTVQLRTPDSTKPGYIMRDGLRQQLLAIKHQHWLKYLLWSEDEGAAAREADQLIDFLCDISVVLVNPSPAKVLCLLLSAPHVVRFGAQGDDWQFLADELSCCSLSRSHKARFSSSFPLCWSVRDVDCSCSSTSIRFLIAIGCCASGRTIPVECP